MKNPNISYSPSFVGHVNNSHVLHIFLAAIRKTLKGTGYSVWLRSRNPDRKQFYPESSRTVIYRDGTKWTRPSSFQQDLPPKFASYWAMYVRTNVRDYSEGLKKSEKKLTGVVSTVRNAALLCGIDFI